MWEKRDDIEPIYPVKQMSRYPRFCKILSLKDLQHEEKISPQGSERLKEIDKRCLENSRNRAKLVLSLKQQDMYPSISFSVFQKLRFFKEA